MFENHKRITCFFMKRKTSFVFAVFIISFSGFAQNSTSLNELSSFKLPAASWRAVSDVRADLNNANALITTNGTGVLVNLPDKKNAGADLYTNLQHGDADVELDFMMAKRSNSGIYLQGRYEVQLLDSWGVNTTKPGDNGGIYQRWDESKPEGQKGYQGYAPRQSVSRAPGVWQHLKISFQAPRFDNNGRKIENAKMIRVELNGVAIHENVELFGPTRGSVGEEAATGPLRIQGDHGAVAFRNFRIINYDKPRPELVNLKYSVYKGLFENEPEYAKLPPEAEGPSGVLSSNLNNLPDSFLLRYSGILRVKEPGEYTFNLMTAAGRGLLRINNQVVSPFNRRGGRSVKATLPSGDLPFEFLYSKFLDWAKPSIGLTVAGPGIREYIISDGNNLSGEQVDPILVEAPRNTVLRSFVDIPGTRIVHAVSVGSPEGIHYTYDMDKGAIAQVWRGGFLDATPMWHERGDGSSRPTGSVQLFGKPMLTLAKISSAAAAWPIDTTGVGYRPKGYILDDKDRPTFRYLLGGMSVTDAIQLADNNGGVRREITVQNGTPDLHARIAEAKDIIDLGNGLYLVDDKSYYIKLEDTNGAKAIVRDSNGKKELIMPVQTKLKYSILF